MRAGLRFVMALVVSGWLAVSLPATALAADYGECGDIQIVNRHSGWLLGGAKQGVRAVLDGQSLNVCQGGFPGTDIIRASFAWVNIQGPDGWDIVQIGRGKCYDGTGFSQCNGKQNYIWGWGRGSCGLSKAPSTVNLGAASTSSLTYIVQHNSTAWAGYVNGSVRAQVGNGEICWTPSAATWFTETWDSGDALGGSASNRYTINQMYYQNSRGGLYQSLNLDPGANCNIPGGGIYKCDITSSNSVDTWTVR